MKMLAYALVAFSAVAQMALACTPCQNQRNGTYLNEIRPTSDDTLLAATLGIYDGYGLSFSQNATINVETAILTEGWPTGVEIYPPGLARSEPPIDSSGFTVEVEVTSLQATVTEIATGESTTFDIPGAETPDLFTYGWWVSPKFRLCYFVYNQRDNFPSVTVATVPIMGRSGPVLYENQSTLGFAGGNIYDEMRLEAYDDLQIAELPIPCCICINRGTMFFDDIRVETRPSLNDLGSKYAVQYGATVPEDTIIYEAQNAQECSYEGEEASFFLTITNLVDGSATRLDLRVGDNEVCPIKDCCEEDCCGPGTSWESPQCVEDAASTGFNGTYSEDYTNGCIDRVCCEDTCCASGTLYDGSIQSCVPGLG